MIHQFQPWIYIWKKNNINLKRNMHPNVYYSTVWKAKTQKHRSNLSGGCESWTIKKAECQGIDAFELRCWRSLFRVPWTARRSNQNVLKEISPEYSLEGLMLKLKLQCFGHLLRRTDSLENSPDAGKDWRQEEKGTAEDVMVGWHHWLDGL